MPFETYNDARDSVNKVDSDLSQGHVSVQEASTAVNDINKGWNDFAENCQRMAGRTQNDPNVLADFAITNFGQDTFDAFGGIKQGAATGMSSVSSMFTAVDSFKGSWRNPKQAREKLEAGLTQISNSVTQLGNTLNNAVRTGKAISNVLGIGNPTGKIDPNTGKAILDHPILDGIGTFGGNVSNFGTTFAKCGVIGFAGRMTEDISRTVNGSPEGIVTGGAASLTNGNTNLQTSQNTSSQLINDSTGQKVLQSDTEQTDKGSDIDSTSSGRSRSNSDSDDYSADMIYEINVILDGSSSSQNSICIINGEKYKLSGYSLSQELLQPMILSFSIEKDNKIETQSDVVFADSTQLIGKSFEINVSTNKTSQDDDKVTPRKAFVFKGMIIDVSASRATASTQSASVMVASWDALLQNAPHCRSFENMTLNEIISSILQPYGEIKSLINPRFKEKIPYIVQYNQSDYSFISMLAIRFGEWMYSTGEKFVFGEFDEENVSTANLEYPGGSLMSYNLRQNITPFSFNHLLSDYYQFGQDKAVVKESGKNIADGTVNTWTDKAYNASQQHFKNEQITALSSGGFDNGKDEEGADTILGYSLNIESQGKKSSLMTVQGTSKLAMLKIGQTFLIRDNVQNKSGESKDVEQKALKIIGINHSFDYRQEYSNSFTAIPVACNYPSYSNADIFPTAPQQRAKVVENKDEQKLGRIRVQFPWQEIQSKEMKTPWLRIAVPYAGASKGQQFVPEIGEEVMVGFEMNNAERPYIIGSFYNGGNGKPDERWAVSKEENNTSNNIKAIRTRNGHTILFNDKGDAGLMEIYDNKGNTYHITLSADDKKITVYSAGEIEVIADSNINVKAKGDISINADGDIGIKSKGNISMEASKEVSIQASKVKVR